MIIDTDMIVPMTEMLRNFNHVSETVRTHHAAVIVRNNLPVYVVLDYNDVKELDLKRLGDRKKTEG